MRTYTFAAGTITHGFVLSKNERGELVLDLGEYARGSWLNRIPLNKNLQNQPIVSDNIVLDSFLFNAGDDQRTLFILSKDHNQRSSSCLIRFLTIGESGKGNGYTTRITGFRSKSLVGGHGRNNGVFPENGTWSDEIWVVHEREYLRVQLAGCCDTAYAVRVRNGEPTVEPWVESKPRQEPIVVSDNGDNGKHQWRTLKGSHVKTKSVPTWSPGVGAIEPETTDLDAELEEMARATGGRRVGTKTYRPGQLVAA